MLYLTAANIIFAGSNYYIWWQHIFDSYLPATIISSAGINYFLHWQHLFDETATHTWHIDTLCRQHLFHPLAAIISYTGSSYLMSRQQINRHKTWKFPGIKTCFKKTNRDYIFYMEHHIWHDYFFKLMQLTSFSDCVSIETDLSSSTSLLLPVFSCLVWISFKHIRTAPFQALTVFRGPKM